MLTSSMTKNYIFRDLHPNNSGDRRWSGHRHCAQGFFGDVSDQLHVLMSMEFSNFIFLYGEYHIRMVDATIQGSEFHYIYRVTASDLNAYGLIHGGRLLTLCDEVGYVSARRHASGDCLTRAVHQARFHRAAREGEKIIISASVGLTGHSSLWVPVDARSCKDDVCIMDAVFVFVAVDQHFRVREVAGIRAVSEEDKQLQIRLGGMMSALADTAV